ncbi:MAG: SET domain-containing protein [Pirellulales bacterium]
MAKKTPAVRIAPAAFGMGVYALKQFRRGQVIGEVDGTIVHDDNYTSRYCMELGNGQTLEPADPFRFINHSCEPNAELMYYDPETLRAEQSHLLNRLFVQARRTIREGEELSIDYSWPADHAIACGCGARNCRKWIVDPDELHLVESGEVEFVSLPG